MASLCWVSLKKYKAILYYILFSYSMQNILALL